MDPNFIFPTFFLSDSTSGDHPTTGPAASKDWARLPARWADEKLGDGSCWVKCCFFIGEWVEALWKLKSQNMQIMDNKSYSQHFPALKF